MCIIKHIYQESIWSAPTICIATQSIKGNCCKTMLINSCTLLCMHRNSLKVELWLGKDASVYLFSSQYFSLWHETNRCPYTAIYSLSWIELLRKKYSIVSVCKCSLDGGGSSFTVLSDEWYCLLTVQLEYHFLCERAQMLKQVLEYKL